MVLLLCCDLLNACASCFFATCFFFAAQSPPSFVPCPAPVCCVLQAPLVPRLTPLVVRPVARRAPHLSALAAAAQLSACVTALEAKRLAAPLLVRLASVFGCGLRGGCALLRHRGPNHHLSSVSSSSFASSPPPPSLSSSLSLSSSDGALEKGTYAFSPRDYVLVLSAPPGSEHAGGFDAGGGAAAATSASSAAAAFGLHRTVSGRRGAGGQASLASSSLSSSSSSSSDAATAAGLVLVACLDAQVACSPPPLPRAVSAKYHYFCPTL